MLGWVALAEENYAWARQQLQSGETILPQVWSPFSSREYRAWSLAGLGRAAFGLGNRTQAQQHLVQGLDIAVEIRGFIPLLHLMPIVTLLLGNEDDFAAKERAVELHALSISHPFLAKARLFEDIAWRQVRAATASLPPDVVAAAQARGRALDWWETAEALLNELGEWQ